MYCRTFVISAKTKVEHIFQVACDFWGVLMSDYSLFFDSSKGIPEEINKN